MTLNYQSFMENLVKIDPDMSIKEAHGLAVKYLDLKLGAYQEFKYGTEESNPCEEIPLEDYEPPKPKWWLKPIPSGKMVNSEFNIWSYPHDDLVKFAASNQEIIDYIAETGPSYYLKAIKILRELTHCDLKSAKEAIDEVKSSQNGALW
jgi:hypothetical protein